MSNATIVKLTDESFQADVLNSKQLTLVDFWAEWCGPCRAFEPVMDAVASELGDRVIFGKVNIDDYPQLASQYNVRSIPTLMLFKNGQAVDTKAGALPKGPLTEWLNQHL